MDKETRISRTLEREGWLASEDGEPTTSHQMADKAVYARLEKPDTRPNRRKEMGFVRDLNVDHPCNAECDLNAQAAYVHKSQTSSASNAVEPHNARANAFTFTS